jgi:hypothetical protein
MKKILMKIIDWMVEKTNYTPPLPLSIQPTIIKPEDLQHIKMQKAVSKHECYAAQVSPDCFVRQFKYDVANNLLDIIQIKADETPDCIVYSVDILFKCI